MIWIFSKSGVECLDFVGQKVSCSNAAFGFVEAALVFSRNASTKSEVPTPPGQFFGVCFLQNVGGNQVKV